MLTTSGLVRIVKINPVQVIPGKLWRVNLEIESSVKRLKNDNIQRIYERYDAVMFLDSADAVRRWTAQLRPNRIVEIKYAELIGRELRTDNDQPIKSENWKKFFQIKLSPNPNHIIPRDVVTDFERSKDDDNLENK